MAESSNSMMRNLQRLTNLVWKIVTHGAFIALFLFIIAAVRNMDDSNVYVTKCGKDSHVKEAGKCYPLPVSYSEDDGTIDLTQVGKKFGTKDTVSKSIFSECKTGTHILEKNRFDFLDEMNNKVVPLAWTVTGILIAKALFVLFLAYSGFKERSTPLQDYDNWFSDRVLPRWLYRTLTLAVVGIAAAALVLFYAGVASRDTCMVQGTDFHKCANEGRFTLGKPVDELPTGVTTGLTVNTEPQDSVCDDTSDAFDLTPLSDHKPTKQAAVFITCNEIATKIEALHAAFVACNDPAVDPKATGGDCGTALDSPRDDIVKIFGGKDHDGNDHGPINYALMGAYAILCDSKDAKKADATNSKLVYPTDLRDELVDKKVAIWRNTKAANWMLFIIFLGLVMHIYNESRMVQPQALLFWGRTHMVIFAIIVSMLTIMVVSSVQIYQAIGHDDQASAFESCAFASMAGDERYVMSERQERHADGNLFYAAIFSGLVYGGLLLLQSGHKMAVGLEDKDKAGGSADATYTRIWKHIPGHHLVMVLVAGMFLSLAVFFIIRPLQWQSSQTCDIASAEEVNALARSYVAVVIAISIMASVSYAYIHIGKSGLGQADHSVVGSYGANKYGTFGSADVESGSDKTSKREGKMSAFAKLMAEA